jgi:hypothetical protein
MVIGQFHDKRQTLAPRPDSFGRKRMNKLKGMLFYASAIALSGSLAA